MKKEENKSNHNKHATSILFVCWDESDTNLNPITLSITLSSASTSQELEEKYRFQNQASSFCWDKSNLRGQLWGRVINDHTLDHT